MAAPGTVYRSDVVPRWVLWSLAASLVVLGVWAQWRDPGEGGQAGTTSFAVGVVVYALVWGIPLWVALLTAWSVNFYGRVVLDADELRVGRDRVPVRAISRTSVLALARDTPGLRTRLTTSAGEVGPGGSASGTPRLLGGAWGTPLGADSLTMALRDGQWVRVVTSDRQDLIEALLEVVPPDDHGSADDRRIDDER